jgi:hypothetical protein
MASLLMAPGIPQPAELPDDDDDDDDANGDGGGEDGMEVSDED